MKTPCILTVLLLFTVNLYAYDYNQNQPIITDTTYWSNELSAGLNFNQASFSENWRGGGVNSLSIGTIVAGRADYERDRITFDNQLELLYGIVRQEGRERKANDRIFMDSKIGYKLNEDWGSYFSLNFTTQFADGFDYENDERTLVSGFMSPALLTASLGFEYRPSEEFKLRIGPLSPRITFMQDQTIHENVPGNYGVPAGDTYRTELAALQIFATWDRDWTEDFNIRTRYQMFANYETLDWENIEHRLDLTLTAKITDLINVTFTSINVYDNDQDPDMQYSTGLALGILYKVGN